MKALADLLARPSLRLFVYVELRILAWAGWCERETLGGWDNMLFSNGDLVRPLLVIVALNCVVPLSKGREE